MSLLKDVSHDSKHNEEYPVIKKSLRSNIKEANLGIKTAKWVGTLINKLVQVSIVLESEQFQQY